MRVAGVIVMVAAVAFLGVACTDEVARERTSPSATRPEAGRVVALVGTMSGGGSWRGKPALRGIQTALEVLDDAGLELRVFDDAGDRRTATSLVRRATRLDGITGVIYAGVPRALPPAEDALDRAGAPAFLLYGDLHTVDRLTPHVFQMGPTFGWETDLLVRRARRTASAVGLLVEDSLMGEIATASVRNELPGAGLPIERIEVFSPTRLEDLGGHLARLRAAGVGHLFVEASPVEFGRINAALEEMKWSPDISSFDLTLSPALRGPDAPVGSIAADLRARAAHLVTEGPLDDFAAAAERATGKVPLWWEHRAYVATRLVALAASSTEHDDGAEALESLDATQPGLDDISLSADDHLVPEADDVVLWQRVASGRDPRYDEAIPSELPWAPADEAGHDD